VIERLILLVCVTVQFLRQLATQLVEVLLSLIAKLTEGLFYLVNGIVKGIVTVILAIREYVVMPVLRTIGSFFRAVWENPTFAFVMSAAALYVAFELHRAQLIVMPSLPLGVWLASLKSTAVAVFSVLRPYFWQVWEVVSVGGAYVWGVLLGLYQFGYSGVQVVSDQTLSVGAVHASVNFATLVYLFFLTMSQVEPQFSIRGFGLALLAEGIAFSPLVRSYASFILLATVVFMVGEVAYVRSKRQ